jgi:hypothetical protein
MTKEKAHQRLISDGLFSLIITVTALDSAIAVMTGELPAWITQ